MLLKELISIPSVSGQEAQIIAFIGDWLKKQNIQIYFQGPNVVGYVPGVNSNRALVFNGHVDTVVPGDVEAWKFGPYNPVVRDGKLYGLGASDMKSGVAALMEVAQKYSKTKPACDLWFSFVAGEEVDGNGTISFLEWFFAEQHNQGYEVIEGIIAEPTNMEFVGIGHRGNCFAEITIRGDAGHASMPEVINDNVIDQLSELSLAIKKLEARWQKEYGHDHLGSPTIGLTSISAGELSTPNRIPASGKITVDIRTTPLLHNKVNAELRKFTKQLPFNVYFHFIGSSPAGWCSENSIIRALFTKHHPKIVHQTVNGSADLCFFSEKGIPCIIFGPGQRDSMHSIDETFEVEVMDRYVTFVTEFVERFGKS